MEVRARVARDSRLIVPVGACDQYGPHLPIGSGTAIAEAVAAELARDFGVLLAPTLPYGVNVPAERLYAGTGSLREKTLHRALNDLLGSWEDHGFTEFILITAHSYDPHVEAMAAVSGTTARVRVVEVLGLDLSAFLDGPATPEHGGEVMTSLMLYLCPDKVNLDQAVDFQPERSPARGLARLPAASPGSVGQPALASREKGELIYRHIVQKIRSRLFLAEDDDE